MPREIYDKHIKGTPNKAKITLIEKVLCELPDDIVKITGLPFKKVLIKSKIVKHIYDRLVFERKNAEAFDLVIDNLHTIGTEPDKICKNRPNHKKGRDFVLIKKIGGYYFLSPIEVSKAKQAIVLVTAHIINEKKPS